MEEKEMKRDTYVSCKQEYIERFSGNYKTFLSMYGNAALDVIVTFQPYITSHS